MSSNLAALPEEAHVSEICVFSLQTCRENYFIVLKDQILVGSSNMMAVRGTIWE